MGKVLAIYIYIFNVIIQVLINANALLCYFLFFFHLQICYLRQANTLPKHQQFIRSNSNNSFLVTTNYLKTIEIKTLSYVKVLRQAVHEAIQRKLSSSVCTHTKVSTQAFPREQPVQRQTRRHSCWILSLNISMFSNKDFRPWQPRFATIYLFDLSLLLIFSPFWAKIFPR